MITKIDRKAERERRHKRVRTKISGTAECPRLCIYRSNSNIYAQIILSDNRKINLKLYYDKAPITVDNFIDFVDVSKYLLDPEHNLERARCHYSDIVPENIALDDLLIFLSFKC